MYRDLEEYNMPADVEVTESTEGQTKGHGRSRSPPLAPYSVSMVSYYVKGILLLSMLLLKHVYFIIHVFQAIFLHDGLFLIHFAVSYFSMCVAL